VSDVALRSAAPRARLSRWAQLGTLALTMLRGFYRDRITIFLTFLFPLMFLVVFGLIFGSQATESIRIGVVGDGAVLEHLPEGIVDIQRYDTLAEAQEAVRRGDIPAVVSQDGTEVKLDYSAADQVRSGTIQSIIGAVVGQVNQSAAGAPPEYALTVQQVESDTLQPIQFITPGIMSWGVATSAVFGASLTLVGWRRRQVLRRVRLSPTPVWVVLGARVGLSLVVAIVQATIFVLVAMLPIFGLQLSGDWWLGLPVLVAGTLAFLAIGLLVGAISKTEEAASALANFVVLPMAFLSGAFFDIRAAPPWMQSLSNIMPLRHMNDGMLDVMVRGMGAGAIVAPVSILLGFALVVSAVALRVFRWDSI
jgi:ABC-2 type transport system permease protein